jgi:3-phosphoshikimate 1-carboxyvinyltransferase
VIIPGSKSMTNRALVLAALAESRTKVSGALRARDTDLMAAALGALGCDVSTGVDYFDIKPPEAFHGGTTIDCGLAGTVMRFLPPLATLASGSVRFDGDRRARDRPMEPLVRALRSLGADIDGDGLPLTVHGAGGLAGGRTTIDATASSQFVSGLLLAAPHFADGVEVTHRGLALPSLPHVDMTVSMMRERGARIATDTADLTHCSWHVQPGTLRGGEVVIEPDLSNAGPFLAAAMLTGGEVRIAGWPQRTDQAGDAYRWLFTHMGATIRLDAEGLVLTGPDRINGIDADMSQVGELVPTVAAVAAFASEPSTLLGVAHLRGHETDRISALATELRRMGCAVVEHVDGLTIEPGEASPAQLECYDDHRMATFAAIVGLRIPGTVVADIDTTAKTLPDFVQMWHAMLASP